MDNTVNYNLGARNYNNTKKFIPKVYNPAPIIQSTEYGEPVYGSIVIPQSMSASRRKVYRDVPQQSYYTLNFDGEEPTIEPDYIRSIPTRYD